MKERKRRGSIFYTTIIIIAIVLFGLSFYQLPYYILKPGGADVVSKMLHVKGSQKEKGDFMLVTVLVGKADPYQYLWAKMHKYYQILPDQSIQQPDETQQEYDLRQLNYMDDAQKTATYVAYKSAGKNPKIQYQGVLVLNVVSSMPASKELQPGDIIIKVNNKPVKDVTDIQTAIKGKKAGDTVQLTVKRNGKTMPLTVHIGIFPKSFTQSNKKTPGIGFVGSQQFNVKVNPAVSFNTGSIGGPSAGLMMTLEIYEELTSKNIRKGHEVAGTGTIAMNGTVGPIGGISDKVIAASRKGADIFFAPKADGEAKQAQQTAKAIGTKMKVVPVSTFQDALNYLKTVQEK